ncbi:MAG: PaaI family thioesterase [Phycisphaerae bacterium]|nr:PaaI family thioesterase [Phycisphaerae bacterium]
MKNKTDTQIDLAGMCQKEHPGCIVCSKTNKHGLKLSFRVSEPGAIEAEFELDEIFQGYSDMLHGGITCTLLDEAMCQCLFSVGITAVTVELATRFAHPVLPKVKGMIRAKIIKVHSPLYFLEAKILQNEKVLVTAKGKFCIKRTDS